MLIYNIRPKLPWKLDSAAVFSVLGLHFTATDILENLFSEEFLQNPPKSSWLQRD